MRFVGVLQPRHELSTHVSGAISVPRKERRHAEMCIYSARMPIQGGLAAGPFELATEAVSPCCVRQVRRLGREECATQIRLG